MSVGREQRRLAAIIAADVVGYSTMVERDESGTVARLKKLRVELFHPKVREYGGRIVNITGDGTLIELPSAIDAVSLAVDIQRGIADRNQGVAADQQIQFRFGINVGDIIVDENEIYGDGVNIAARLEALSEPGGIWLSARVHDYVRNRTDLVFEDLGKQAVKNISEPVHVYRIELSDVVAPHAVRATGYPSLPNNPSIAVLPFLNISGDAAQDYFVDGITEDLIMALSHVRWFFVTARNSCFAYKGKPTDVRKLARELGVAYVLEGSVRKSGMHIRITTQLIDGNTGNNLWAHRYDRDLKDIFAVQDEITETLVGAIEPELGKAERERARARRPDDLRAWDFYQRGLWHTYKRTREDLAEARHMFEQAIAIDPGLARAYAGAEEAIFFQLMDGHAASGETAKATALELAEKSVSIDGQDAFNRYALGRALTLHRRHEAAIFELCKAIELNPSFAQAHYALGLAHATSGQPAEALPHIEWAMRLSPQDPYFGQFLVRQAEAFLFLGRLEDAVEAAGRSLREPNIQWSRWAILAAAQAHLGRLDEARSSVSSLQMLRPDISLAFIRDYLPIADASAMEVLIGGLRTAGLEE